MDFARSIAHLSILNPGAPTGCTDNTLGGSDVVSPYVAITKGFCFERSLYLEDQAETIF